jgi:hypothetical protein
MKNYNAKLDGYNEAVSKGEFARQEFLNNTENKDFADAREDLLKQYQADSIKNGGMVAIDAGFRKDGMIRGATGSDADMKAMEKDFDKYNARQAAASKLKAPSTPSGAAGGGAASNVISDDESGGGGGGDKDDNRKSPLKEDPKQDTKTGENSDGKLGIKSTDGEKEGGEEQKDNNQQDDSGGEENETERPEIAPIDNPDGEGDGSDGSGGEGGNTGNDNEVLFDIENNKDNLDGVEEPSDDDKSSDGGDSSGGDGGDGGNGLNAGSDSNFSAADEIEQPEPPARPQSAPSSGGGGEVAAAPSQPKRPSTPKPKVKSRLYDSTASSRGKQTNKVSTGGGPRWKY